MFSAVIVLFSLLGLTASDSSHEWSHHDESAWPGECGYGKQQSPVNIVPRDAVVDPHKAVMRGPLVFRGYEDVVVTPKNTGYKVSWALKPGTPAPTLSGGPLRGNYSFTELHFHWLSEHTIDGIKYPLEMHLVHVKYGFTLREAMLRPDALAVIGVFAEVGTPNVSPVLDDLLLSVSYILTKTNTQEEIPSFNVNLRQLFSPEPQDYYTYHGSLTTPMCSEVVTWLVMAHPTLISHENYKNVTRADLSGINNDRAVQPLGSRIIYRSMAPSCSTAITPNSLAALAALAGCVASKLSNSVVNSICKLGNMKRKLLGLPAKMCS